MARNAPDANRVITAETFLTSHECGAMLQCNPSSINKWVKEGKIPAHRTPGGHRRIKAGDLVAFLKRFENPIPAALAGIAEPPPPPTPPPPPKPAKKTKRK